jgi:hypothetical protein
MPLFSPQPEPEHPQLLPGIAIDAQPGDEVIYVDEGGQHQVVHLEYLLARPEESTVTLVPAGRGQCVLGREHPVLILRGAEALLARLAPL